MRLNETATSAPRVWLGPERLLFVGALGTLDWHRHSFSVTLVGLDGDLTMETAYGVVTGQIVHAPPAIDHKLWCGAGAVLTCYVGPHCRAFADLRGAMPAAMLRNAQWNRALDRWWTEGDPEALAQAVDDSWRSDPHKPLDHRVVRVARQLRQGRGLRASPDELAAEVNLSASRLSHLVKGQTGSTLGQLQMGYRFVVAGEAMLDSRTFTDAAYRADFSDSAHFSRAFRASYGVAPTRILWASTTWEWCDAL